MRRHFANLIAVCLLCAVCFQSALAQQRSVKQRVQKNRPTLQQEIDDLKQSQQQILKELEEIKKLLQARQEPVPASEPQRPQAITLNIHGEPFRGESQARLAIIEYSDFECPFCGKYVRETYPKIDENYIKTGKIKYLFRDLPLPIHPNAMQAARAARCAGEQGKFWEMHDRLFANQSALGAVDLQQHAVAIGLDSAKFVECLAQRRYEENIRRSMTGAERMGVDGTPAFLIGVVSPNGDVVRVSKALFGAEPYETFKATLDALLASQSK